LPSGKLCDLTPATKADEMNRMVEHTNSRKTRQQTQDRLCSEIRKGLDDIEAGRTVDGDAAFDAVRHALLEKRSLPELREHKPPSASGACAMR